MSELVILARDHTFGVSTTNGTYTTISGINNFTIAVSNNTIDARDFDTGGYEAELRVSRGVTITLEGDRLVDLSTGTRDAGQALVEASFNQFGTSGLRYYRVAMDDGATPPVERGHFIFRATANAADMGGGNDDKMPWGVDLPVFGAVISASGTYQNMR